MEIAPNPYESPQATNEPRLEKPEVTEPREGWKYVLLAVAILLGFLSFVPWLAAILGIASAPVFLRYYRRRRGAAGSANLAGRAAGAMGITFLSIAVLASISGAFLGTCSVTTWGLALSGILIPVKNDDIYLHDIQLSFYGGTAIGVVAGALTCVWLVRRIRRAA